jgi:arsenate reductase (glutaredoxin)
MSVTIYHNPDCGTSRNTLAMIRRSGVEPTIIEYLKTPPSREKLVELIKAMGIPVRALLREKGTPFRELGLADPKWTDDELIRPDACASDPHQSADRGGAQGRQTLPAVGGSIGPAAQSAHRPLR